MTVNEVERASRYSATRYGEEVSSVQTRARHPFADQLIMVLSAFGAKHNSLYVWSIEGAPHLVFLPRKLTEPPGQVADRGIVARTAGNDGAAARHEGGDAPPAQVGGGQGAGKEGGL